jgi:hypothetical protein
MGVDRMADAVTFAVESGGGAVGHIAVFMWKITSVSKTPEPLFPVTLTNVGFEGGGDTSKYELERKIFAGPWKS